MRSSRYSGRRFFANSVSPARLAECGCSPGGGRLVAVGPPRGKTAPTGTSGTESYRVEYRPRSISRIPVPANSQKSYPCALGQSASRRPPPHVEQRTDARN